MRLFAQREWGNFQPIVANRTSKSALLLEWQLTKNLVAERNVQGIEPPTAGAILTQSFKITVPPQAGCIVCAGALRLSGGAWCLL